MTIGRARKGFTTIDLALATAAVILAIAIALPSLHRARGASLLGGSLNNLATLGLAHAVYSYDWNGRQVSMAVDDLATYGNSAAQAIANYEGSTGSPHPPIVAGWCNGNGTIWGFWFDGTSIPDQVQPFNFTGSLQLFGTFRLAGMRPLHDYVAGRYYSQEFFAPNDPVVQPLVEPFFDEPFEFTEVVDNPALNFYPGSYVWSPAALFDPEVFRAEADGGWQSPWILPDGFAVPPLNAATYPDLKTQLIEHHWLQNAPAECNPEFEDLGLYMGCEPYYFNHGIGSSPAALFYDGHTRLLPNTEALSADQIVLEQTGGVDGLWHRGTPFAGDGYLIGAGFDGVPLSHHVLTTDGILGRDTIAGAAVSAQGAHRWRPHPPGTGSRLVSPRGEDMQGVEP